MRALAQRRRARNDMRPDDRQRRGASAPAWSSSPHAAAGSGPTDRAAPNAGCRSSPPPRSAARSRFRRIATDRRDAHSGDRRHRAACGHAVAATRSADHAARRTGTIVGRARASRRRAGRRAPQPRHRADRSARHRQIGAVALRRPRPARCLRRDGGRTDDRHRGAALHRRIAAPAAMRTRRSTRRPPSWPTSTRCGLRSVTTG